jgi:hypothetical protein
MEKPTLENSNRRTNQSLPWQWDRTRPNLTEGRDCQPSHGKPATPAFIATASAPGRTIDRQAAPKSIPLRELRQIHDADRTAAKRHHHKLIRDKQSKR